MKTPSFKSPGGGSILALGLSQREHSGSSGSAKYFSSSSPHGVSMMFSGVILLWCGYFTSSTLASPITPISGVLKSCEAHDDKLDDCLLYNLNVIVPSLKTGWEWQELPGIDPVELPPKLSPSYEDGNITLDLILTQSTLHGLSDTRVVVVRSKAFSIGKLEVMTTTPKITYTGLYASEGYTGIFPLHSTGSFNVTLVGVNTAWVAYFSKMNMSHESYMQVETLKLDAMPVQIFIEGAHTFDGSNEIATDMQTSLNANSIELYNLVKPRLMAFLSSELRDYINGILLTSPIENLVHGLDLQDWKKR